MSRNIIESHSTIPKDPLFSQDGHRNYLKQLLVSKMEKKFTHANKELIYQETNDFLATENVSKESVKVLEQRIQQKLRKIHFSQ